MSRRDQDIRDAILAALPRELGAVALSQIEGRLQADGMAVTRARLQEIIDDELANLHEGNALRSGIRRSQFEAWSSPPVALGRVHCCACKQFRLAAGCLNVADGLLALVRSVRRH